MKKLTEKKVAMTIFFLILAYFIFTNVLSVKTLSVTDTSQCINIPISNYVYKNITVDTTESVIITITTLNQQGFNSGKSAIDDTGNVMIGSTAWLNPSSALESDGEYARALQNPKYGITHRIKISDFGFNIPSNAKINGIEVVRKIKASQLGSSNYITDINLGSDGVRLFIGGVYSKSKGKTQNVQPSEQTDTFGGISDLWTEPLFINLAVPQNINGNSFGVSQSFFIQATSTSTIAYIDSIKARVYYTYNNSFFIPKNCDSNFVQVRYNNQRIDCYDGKEWNTVSTEMNGISVCSFGSISYKHQQNNTPNNNQDNTPQNNTPTNQDTENSTDDDVPDVLIKEKPSNNVLLIIGLVIFGIIIFIIWRKH